jgi:hypothetical protein
MEIQDTVDGREENRTTESQERSDGEAEEEEEEEEEVEYLRKFFVMPDFHRVMKGFVKEEGDAFAADEQVTLSLCL